MPAISRDLGTRCAIAYRVEANAEIAGRDSQAVKAAGDRHRTSGHTRPVAVIVGTKDHIAGGDGRHRTHLNVTPRHRGQIASRDGRRSRDGHIVHGLKGKHASSRLGCCRHVHIISRRGRDTTVDACDRRSDIHVVHSVQGQCRGLGPGHRVIYVDVTKRARAAGAALQGDVGQIQLGAKRRAGDVSPRGGHIVIKRVDQPGAGLAASRKGRDARTVGHFYMCSRGFNKAPIPAIWRRGIQLSTHVYRAYLHVAHQPDRAVVVLNGLRLDHAGVIHCAL